MRVHFAIPGDLSLPTGGYAYDRAVMRHLPSAGVAVSHLALPAGFPSPSAAELEATARLLAAVPAEDVLLVDGLAYGAFPVNLIEAAKAAIVALVHHPLALETGLPPERAAALLASETAALAAARQVIVTSSATAATLIADYAVPAERVTIAEPGTLEAPLAPGSGGTPRLLSVGSILPRKGYDVLVSALARISDLDWHATIVGARDRAPETAAALDQQILDAGLDERIAFTGPLSEEALHDEYQRSDLFVMASHYEGYGMAWAEALAHGLPIVTTLAGAAADTVPDEAALKVPAGDAEGLAAALRRVLMDGTLREAKRAAARAAAARLPRWPETTKTIANALRRAAENGEKR